MSDSEYNTPLLRFFAPCPAGITDLLAGELKDFGAQWIREQKAGVMFEGSLETGYRACLWSRTASRILLQIAEVDAGDATELYHSVGNIDWSRHLDLSRTFAIDFSGTNSHITHTGFGALKVKDAIVDQFRARFNERPSINLDQPDVRIAVHLNRGLAVVSIDLSGDPLHRRGYRIRGVPAPLKENLAAALLLRSGWPAIAAAGGRLIDPMCGSGTLLIEAAMMLGDIAPGLRRRYFGLIGWKGHDEVMWLKLVNEARQRRTEGALVVGRVIGADENADAVSATRANLAEAGFSDVVTVECRSLEQWSEVQPGPGLLITNPPYGERLGEAKALEPLYATLGRMLRECFVGWRAVVFTGNPPLALAIGMRAKRSHTFFNGAIECRLLRFEVLSDARDGRA
jgi:23S rRNA (guanine2445-N2)-methyltransferase / 23S rRNA (guanine2069-N7)-methyltransferase